MAYVPVPKDLTRIKTKVMFNLTKRQIIFFGLGALMGVPIFFLLKPYINISAAALVMIAVMLPFFLFAMYEKNGQPFEEILKNIIEVRFRRPKERPYQTNNFYAALHRQAALDKEVQEIVQNNHTGKAHPRGQKGNRRRRKAGPGRRSKTARHGTGQHSI